MAETLKSELHTLELIKKQGIIFFKPKKIVENANQEHIHQRHMQYIPAVQCMLFKI